MKLKDEIVVNLFNALDLEHSELDETILEKIRRDIDINSALNKIVRGVAGKKVVVRAKNEEKSEEAEAIGKRLSELKYSRSLNHMMKARVFGYSAFEISYNHDFTARSLIPIPHKNIDYNSLEKKWYLKASGQEIEMVKGKFLICIHRWSPGHPKGESILEACNVTFMDKEMFRRQLRGLSKRYGEVITVYAYNENSDEEERVALKEKVEEQHGKGTIGVPIKMAGGTPGSLKDMVQFIKLSDIDPDVYTKLEDREKRRLIQNILGSTLTLEDSSANGKGTQALGNVHQDGLEEVIREATSFVEDCLQNLLEVDGYLQGYDSKEFYFELIKAKSIDEKNKEKKEEAEIQGVKIDNLSKLSGAGIEVSAEYIAKYLGVDPGVINVIRPQKLTEFSESGKKTKAELKQERIADLEEQLNKNIEESIKEFSLSLETQLKEQIETIQEGDEKFRFNLSLGDLEDNIILAKVKGYVDSKDVSELLNLDKFNPFKLKYEEAIKYFNDKTPISYEALEEISEEVRSKFFWLKKSTDLECTDRVFFYIRKVLEEGSTLEDFKQAAQEILKKAGLSQNGHYLETVFRTNIQSAYSAGNWKQQYESRERFPYLQYIITKDINTSDICLTFADRIYRYDSDFWKKYYPPNHFRCRATTISLSSDEIKESGLSISRKMIDSDVGSFKGNPGESYWKTIESLVKEKEVQLKLWEQA